MKQKKEINPNFHASKKDKEKKNVPDPFKLTVKEAVSVLATFKEKGKLRIHTLEGGGFYMSGCNMDLKDVKERMEKSQHVALSGPHMRGMGHGVAYWDEKSDNYLFLETDKTKLKALRDERKLSDTE